MALIVRLRMTKTLPRLLTIGKQVEVALALAQFHVLQAVKLLRQGAQRLRQDTVLAHVQRALFCTCPEQVAPYLYEIADVEQLDGAVGLFTEIVDAEEDLDTTGAILDMREGRLAHLAHQANAAHQRKIATLTLPFVEMFKHLHDGVGALSHIWIRLDALLVQGM